MRPARRQTPSLTSISMSNPVRFSARSFFATSPASLWLSTVAAGRACGLDLLKIENGPASAIPGATAAMPSERTHFRYAFIFDSPSSGFAATINLCTNESGSVSFRFSKRLREKLPFPSGHSHTRRINAECSPRPRGEVLLLFIDRPCPVTQTFLVVSVKSNERVVIPSKEAVRPTSRVEILDKMIGVQ